MPPFVYVTRVCSEQVIPVRQLQFCDYFVRKYICSRFSLMAQFKSISCIVRYSDLHFTIIVLIQCKEILLCEGVMFRVRWQQSTGAVTAAGFPTAGRLETGAALTRVPHRRGCTRGEVQYPCYWLSDGSN